MSNNYGFSKEELKEIGSTKCVYCRKEMDSAHIGKVRSDWATIEHLCEKPPFYKKDGLEIKDLAICCWSCNSSRREKTLSDWFEKPYCKTKDIPISAETVADVVKEYLRRNKSTQGGPM